MATTKTTAKKTPTKALAAKAVTTKAIVKADKKTTAIEKAPKVSKAIVAKTKPVIGALVAKFRTHKEDTGSTEVQIAVMTEQMEEVTTHLQLHHKDHDARRGLLVMVGKRRRLLNYLRRTNEATYQAFIKELKLRK
jgi:small subunit ribosomal protein S15